MGTILKVLLAILEIIKLYNTNKEKDKQEQKEKEYIDESDKNNEDPVSFFNDKFGDRLLDDKENDRTRDK